MEGARRAAALQGYGLLDSPNEPAFDAIVREAAAALASPIALISLLDEHRQWFKARVGLAASETPIAISFCTHAVRGHGVFEVRDATRDERFAANPLVTGEPGIRFYAGVPLQAEGGQRVGTLCVIDDKPRRSLTDEQRETLQRLADKVMQLMEARRLRLARAATRRG